MDELRAAFFVALLIAGVMLWFLFPFLEHWANLRRYRNSPRSEYPTNGHDFEHWVAEKLRAMGWDASVTTASGDQGLDIIATKNNYTFGIQCKRHSKPCTNKAIQEVIAGGRYYDIPNLAVVASGGYTGSAIDLADRSNVFLFSNFDLDQFDVAINPDSENARTSE